MLLLLRLRCSCPLDGAAQGRGGGSNNNVGGIQARRQASAGAGCKMPNQGRPPYNSRQAHPRMSVARRNGSGCVSCPVQLLPPAADFLAARLRVTRPLSSPCAPNTNTPPLPAALECEPPLCSAARWSVLSANGSGTVGALVSTCGTPSWPLRSRRMRLLPGGGAQHGGGVAPAQGCQHIAGGHNTHTCLACTASTKCTLPCLLT